MFFYARTCVQAGMLVEIYVDRSTRNASMGDAGWLVQRAAERGCDVVEHRNRYKA